MSFIYNLPDEQLNPKQCETDSNALVIIGANGAGKSKLGAWIEQQDLENIHRIGAQRNLNFNENITLKSYSQAEDIVFWGTAEENQKNGKGYRWEWGKSYTTKLMNDFEDVLAALIALKNNENDNFVNQCKKAEETNNEKPHTPVTSIDKLSYIWNDVFPQRDLLIEDSKFYAFLQKNGKEMRYSANQMSDGERSVLYLACGSCSQVIERTKVFNNNPSLHNCKVYGIIDRDYRSDYEIEKYKENNIFTLNVAEVENLFITEELIRLMAEHMGKEANTTFEEIKKYVIHTRFSHQIESQICQSVVAQIKYKLSCVDISKQNSEKAKASLETAFKSINYEQVSSNETEKFQKILSEQNYADVIKVFNEKGIAKSIGQYFNIDNSSYCTTVISLLNGSKHNDIVAALLPYFPTEIPR